jgi:hypothetical protein
MSYLILGKAKPGPSKRKVDGESTPPRSRRKATVTTPQSGTSTNTTRSTSTTGTAKSIKQQVEKLNMDLSESEDDHDYHKPIEEIPWFRISDLRGYLKQIKPDKRSQIMTESPSQIVTMTLYDYSAQTLKYLLSYFKARYHDVGLGGIEEHESKNKAMLMKELLSAIGKIKVYMEQSE